MMNTTHGAIAISLASATVVWWPEVATVAAVAVLVGSVVPDLDLFVGVHRRSLHFPVLGWAVAIPAIALSSLSPSAVTAAVAFFLLGIAIHSSMDVLGGGPEMRPWITRSNRAVYAHVPGRWIRPRRWIRYDGAPEDFVLGAVAAVPALTLYEGWIRVVIAAGLVISLVYTVYRKRIPEVSEYLLG